MQYTVVQLYVLEACSLSEQFTINVIIILIYAITTYWLAHLCVCAMVFVIPVHILCLCDLNTLSNIDLPRTVIIMSV